MIYLALLILALLYIAIYNRFITKRNQISQSFSSIDVYLKKRYDLIPNLVATVKGYADHEKKVLSKIVELRNKPYTSLSEYDKIELDNAISKARANIYIVAEKYPELKASENFSQLQRALNETEEQLSAARRAFNASVTEYNNLVQKIPSTIIASLHGFTIRELFVVNDEERQVVDVDKSFNS